MSGSTPRVTFVVAVYDGDNPRFLGEALDSVRAQTWSDFEARVVLDGPVRPELRAVVEAAAAEDPRVQVMPLPENAGPALARNAGIAAARGEYVAVLDADDVAAPRRVARQIEFIEETGAAVVGSWYEIIDESGTVVGRKRVPVHPNAVRRWLPIFNPLAHSTVLARTDVLRAHPFPEDHRFGEDYRLWVTLARAGYELRNMPEYLVRYRVDPQFLARRQGWPLFRSDLATKLEAVALYPAPLRPGVAALALAASSSRLLPAGLLGAAYRLRNLLPFGP